MALNMGDPARRGKTSRSSPADPHGPARPAGRSVIPLRKVPK